MFNKGDYVEGVQSPVKGKKGYIVENKAMAEYLVYFPYWKGGHDGDGKAPKYKNRKGFWWVEESQLTLVRRADEFNSTPKDKPVEKAQSVTAGLSGLLGTIEQEINNKIDSQVKAVEQKLSSTLKEVDEKVMSGVSLNISYDDKKSEVKGLKHSEFTKLLEVVAQRLPVMMVGPAGTGKTFAAEQIGQALGLKVYTMSVGAQTSKTDIAGYMSASGNYVKGWLYDSYKYGGISVMDEIDAGNSNVTIMLNSALSGDSMLFPNGEVVKKHKDFMFIATANTFGHGASREYVGRNQLDAATLDRFVTIDWGLDDKLEEKIVNPYTHGEQWLKTIREVRKYAETSGIRMIISPRATLHGAKMLEKGLDKRFVVESTIVKSAPANSKDDIRTKAMAV